MLIGGCRADDEHWAEMLKAAQAALAAKAAEDDV